MLFEPLLGLHGGTLNAIQVNMPVEKLTKEMQI